MFFCFMIFAAKIMENIRPPLPCALCNELAAHCIGDSSFQSFLLRNTSWGCGVGKICNFVCHLDPRTEIKSLPNVYQGFLDPFFLTFYKKIRVSSLKNMTFRPQKIAFRPIFCRIPVFKGLNIFFISHKNLFFCQKSQRMGQRTLGKHLFMI